MKPLGSPPRAERPNKIPIPAWLDAAIRDISRNLTSENLKCKISGDFYGRAKP